MGLSLAAFIATASAVVAYLGWRMFVRPKRGMKPVIGESGVESTPIQAINQVEAATGQPWHWKKFLESLSISNNGIDRAAVQAVKSRAIYLEIGLILIIVLSFCTEFLDLGTKTLLPGVETEMFQSLDLMVTRSLRQDGHFPQWNPFYFTGQPMVANPMFHSFNPLITIPGLLFGVYDGFKLAVLASFLIGALGMWWLAYLLGMGRVSRIWMALLFAFAGQPIARFFQGEYLFVLGWAWIPYCMAGLIALERTGRKIYVGITAAALAMVFLSGNAYYAYYLVIIYFIFLAIAWLRPQGRFPFFTIDARNLVPVLIACLLALGLAAIQLLPTIQMWPLVSKGEDLTGSQTVQQVFLDFLSKDTFRPDAYSVFPAREEFYAYIGVGLFIPLLLLPLALVKKDRKIIYFCAFIILFGLLWIDVKDMPWVKLFTQTHILAQFRHPVRMILFIEIALLILSGFCLDIAWGWATQVSKTENGAKPPLLRRTAGYVVAAAIVALIAGSVYDLYTTNKPHTRTTNRDESTYASMLWIRGLTDSTFYLRRNPNNSGYEAAVEANLRLVNPLYHYSDIRNPFPVKGQRQVVPEPNVIVQLAQSKDHSIPEGGVLAGQVEGYAVYTMPNALPFAFTVDNDVLYQDISKAKLKASEVKSQTIYTEGTDKMELIVDGKVNSTLVLLVTSYPGWQAWVDGKRADLSSVNNLLAIPALSGIHSYRFEFHSLPFQVGLWVSLLSLLFLAYLVISDTASLWHPAWARARAWAGTHPFRRARQALAPARLMSVISQPEGLKFHVGGFQVQITRPGASPLEAVSVLAGILFGLTILVYLVTRFWGLDRFPIYFFSDEAIQTTLAADLIRDHFHNAAGDLLPTYFMNVDKYNLSFSVYLQVIPYLLFGKSVWVTRGISILVTLLGVSGVSLTLKNIFKSRYWWCAGMLLSIIPTWFLHSRTAFETVLMVSFYTMFLYCYLMYRTQNPKYLYAALIFGGLAFYSYSPGQVVVVMTGLVMLLSDLRYHWQQRKTGFRGLLILGLLILPYLRFNLLHPTETVRNLQVLGSYWLLPTPFIEKLRQYGSNYLYALNPAYWFLPNQHDLNRHLMKGYGHVFLAMLPLILLGLWKVVSHLKSSPHRLILLSLLVVPSGAALVGIGITRVLVMVIPFTILAALGVTVILEWLEQTVSKYKVLAVGLFAVLVVVNFVMASDALRNGPTWFQDYGLGGMQYGGQQLFKEVADYHRASPDTKIVISPSWANGTPAIMNFFLNDTNNISMGTIDQYMFNYKQMDPNLLFVMIPDEYEKTVNDSLFTNVQVEKKLYYPNGRAGFYFVRLRYADNATQILDQQAQERRALLEEDIIIHGSPVHIGYSRVDMGKIQDAFDGNVDTVTRTLEANPFVFDLTYPEERTFKGIQVHIGSAATRIKVEVYVKGKDQPLVFQQDAPKVNYNRDVGVDFGGEQITQHMVIQVESINEAIPAHVHVWEIQFE